MAEQNLIAALRERAGLTQVELASQLSVSENTLANWERGSASKWISQLHQLCSLLHCTLDDLIPHTEEDDDKRYILTSRILDAVQSRAKAVSKQDRKAAAKIASYATFHDPALRHWIEQADRILDSHREHSAKNPRLLNSDTLGNALILQNLRNQLSLLPPDKVEYEAFRNLVTLFKLKSNLVEDAAQFGEDCFQRNHILQAHPLAVYVIGWQPNQFAGMHHHGNALDAIQVIRGEMDYGSLSREEYEALDGVNIPFEGGSVANRYPAPIQKIKEGDWVFIDRYDAHQIANSSTDNLITLHIRFGMPPFDEKWSLTGESQHQHVTWQQVDECRLALPH